MSRTAITAVAVVLVLAAALGGRTALAADSPGTTLDGPAGVTRDATPTFTFSSDDPAASYSCSVDAGAWAPCTSPTTLSLADGEHAFAVRATDEAGNTDPSPATRRFVVDTGTVDTTIEAGPSGLTNDATPSFGFGSTVTGATFECRVDGAGSPVPAFAPCSAPLTLPALPNGDFAFLVRARAPSGAVDISPARRPFSVDAVAPDTRLTGGPAEGGQSDSRTPTLTYDAELGARFECRLDNAVRSGVDLVAWQSCPAGAFTAPSLGGGEHTFEVRAIDAAGNADATPAKRTFRVVACERVVRFGLVEATGECLLDTGTRDAPRWESEGDVNVNGLPLPAPGPAKVILNGPAEGSTSGGSLAVTNLNLTIAEIPLWSGAFKVDLPAGGAGDEKEVKSFDLGASGTSFLGLKALGKAELRFGRRRGTDERYAVLGVRVALPEVFKSGPGAGAGGVTGDVAVRIDRQRGVQVDGVKVAVNNAYIGTIGVKTVCLSYVAAGATFVTSCEPPRIGSGEQKPFLECKSDATADRWDGAAAIVLPTPSNTELGLWAGLRGGRLSHAGAYVDRLGTLVPIAPGVFLDQVAIGVCLDPPPFQIKGQAAIGFGPDWGGKKAALVTGSFQYRDAYDGQPWMIRAAGSLAMYDYQLADAYFQYQSSGMIDFGFNAGFAFGPASLKGGVSGWLEARQGGRYNVGGYIDVCVDGVACAKANAVISSVGAAGCITVTVVNFPVPHFVGGWPWEWETRYEPVQVTGGAGYTFASRKLDLMAGSCSMGPWEVARAAQAGAAPTKTLTIGANTPAIAVRVKGAATPPKIVLVGPGGRRIASPARPGGAFARDSHLLAEDEATKTTQVMVAKPAAGEWRVEAQPGSEIVGVDHADFRPPATIGGRVRGTGHRRVLDYGMLAQPGQTVTLIERGPRTMQTLGVAKATRCKGKAGRNGIACGSIPFAPGMGGRGPRRIEAIITERGLPRQTKVIARYTAPADRRAGTPRRLRARRTSGAVIAAWKAAPMAAKYNVVVTTSEGRRSLFIRTARQRSVRIGGVERDERVRIAVRAMRRDGVEGRSAVTVLRPRPAARPKTSRKRKTTTRRTAR